MRTLTGPILAVALCAAAGLAQSPRFVVDDDAYIDKVTSASAAVA